MKTVPSVTALWVPTMKVEVKYKIDNKKVVRLFLLFNKKKFEERWPESPSFREEDDEEKSMFIEIPISKVRQISSRMRNERDDKWSYHYFMVTREGDTSRYRIETYENSTSLKHLWFDPLTPQMQKYILKKRDALLTLLEG